MLKYSFYVLVVAALAACTAEQPEQQPIQAPGASGKLLAARHCSSCHAYVAPDELPKSIWEQNVLPVMGFRMGIAKGGRLPDSLFEEGVAGQMVRRAGIYPSAPVISQEQWEKIKEYYRENAPDALPAPRKAAPIRMGLPHFRYRPSRFSQQPPLTIMVKLLTEKKMVAFGDGKRNISSLNFLDRNLEKQHNLLLPTTPIHYREKQDTIWLTTVGRKMYPSDTPGGMLQKVYSHREDQPANRAHVLIKDMQRPVDITYADLNRDGREDIIACEFGNLVGKLAWYENRGNGHYRLHILKQVSGASVVHVRDVNDDGRPDILALLAQGDEGIFLFINRGDGRFREERLLRFSPLNGSTYFELVDFNGDGHSDILYTCGDNADFSPVLKENHGIYVFLNDGHFNFTQHYFYQLNGAYKALARDYDRDGDLDIAAISFFPDYRRYPEEGFVYLQNQGDFTFRAYSFPEVTAGRWIVMDAADWDSDGDTDLALGSFVGFKPKGDTTGLYKQWVSDSPSVVVLENTIR